MAEEAGKMRGAKPTPRHKLQAAKPHIIRAFPPEFAVIPSQLDMWGNDQFGDCVTAEECFAKAAWSKMCGLPETFITAAEAVSWARQHGYLNGAILTDVMDTMASNGLTVGSTPYLDGGYTGVDYSNEDALKSAISTGPVKIGIDADGLPSGAGNSSGWFSTDSGVMQNEDHCVALCGYGTVAYLYGQLGLPVPSGLDPALTGYLLYTWKTIGFVTYGWIMGKVAEAWVRNPTTIGQTPTPTPGPTPPGPGPGPLPTPPPTFPNYVGTVAFTLPWFGAVSGTIAMHPATTTGNAAAINPLSLITDLYAIFTAYQTNSITAVETAVEKLLSDLGFNIPIVGHGKISALTIPNAFTVLMDAFALYAAVQTANPLAVTAALTKLLSDFGVTL